MCIRDRSDGVRQQERQREPGHDEQPDQSPGMFGRLGHHCVCLLYTSDAADERSSVDLGGRRIIKKKKRQNVAGERVSGGVKL